MNKANEKLNLINFKLRSQTCFKLLRLYYVSMMHITSKIESLF